MTCPDCILPSRCQANRFCEVAARAHERITVFPAISVQRYDLSMEDGTPHMKAVPEGPYVRYEDYQRVLIERNTLEAMQQEEA